MLTRRAFAASTAFLPFAPGAAWAETDAERLDRMLASLVTGPAADFEAALRFFRETGDITHVPSLIVAMRFTRAPSEYVAQVARDLTGLDNTWGWFDWMLWQEQQADLVPHESFMAFKRQVMLWIDPNFEVFLRPEYLDRDRMGIRLEEITWGGVRKDGIPSLDGPEMIAAEEADYLAGDDLVFGVEIDGDIRAYPLRVMGWHEMFNDVIGGVPVALAYCTLCGSGILFETDMGREQPFIFGSSGFLYRSNKLMFDRETHSLWNQFTGRPVVGPLYGSGIELRQRPVVIDTWENWVAANPGTTVLSLNTGHDRDYGSGVVYARYFASPDLMFPTEVDESRFAQKSYVFGVRQFGGAKAWPLEAFEGGRVLNDGMLDTPMVLIGDAATRTVRAYERGDLAFEGAGAALVSSDGARWEAREDALVAADGRSLPRVAGHIAYWFAWNGYLAAESELYEP